MRPCMRPVRSSRTPRTPCAVRRMIMMMVQGRRRRWRKMLPATLPQRVSGSKATTTTFCGCFEVCVVRRQVSDCRKVCVCMCFPAAARACCWVSTPCRVRLLCFVRTNNHTRDDDDVSLAREHAHAHSERKHGAGEQVTGGAERACLLVRACPFTMCVVCGSL